MRFHSLIGAACLCAAVAMPSLAHAQSHTWVHPGLLNSKAYLDKIQLFSATSNADAYNAYNAYRSTYTDTSDKFGNQYQQKGPYATVYASAGCSSTHPTETAFEQDAMAAYYNAIRWVRDGNADAAAKAKAILGSWAATFQDMQVDPCPGNYSKQARNEAVWFIPVWINTAEILRDYSRPGTGKANWDATPQVNFTAFMDKLWSEVVPNDYHVDLSWEGNNNITASTNLAGMALAVWKGGNNFDDFTMHRDNMKLLAKYIIQNDDGEVREFERETDGDCVHPQYTMIALLQAAWIERNQTGGVDIFETLGGQGTVPRLLKGLKYIGERFNGVPLADDPNTPPNESLWTCNKSGQSLRDGYYQLAREYYGSRMPQAFEQAYQAQMNSTASPTLAKPRRLGFFTDILRVTHDPQ